MISKTIKKEIKIESLTLHSGEKSTIILSPFNDGIVFNVNDGPLVKLDVNTVEGNFLSTNLIYFDKKIKTIEHLLSSLHALQITDLKITLINSYEIPFLDGSAYNFIELLEKNITNLDKPTNPIIINKDIFIDDKDKKISAHKNDKHCLEIEYEIDFEHPKIKKQYFNFVLTQENFIKEIAKAKSFGFLKDWEHLKKLNLSLGASLDNVIVLDDNEIINKNKLTFNDEFVRHKILDIIGDLFIAGRPVFGKIKAYKGSHLLHNLLIKKILEQH